MIYGKVTCCIETEPQPVILTVGGLTTYIKQGDDLVTLGSIDAARELAQDILSAIETLETGAASR